MIDILRELKRKERGDRNRAMLLLFYGLGSCALTISLAVKFTDGVVKTLVAGIATFFMLCVFVHGLRVEKRIKTLGQEIEKLEEELFGPLAHRKNRNETFLYSEDSDLKRKYRRRRTLSYGLLYLVFVIAFGAWVYAYRMNHDLDEIIFWVLAAFLPTLFIYCVYRLEARFFKLREEIETEEEERFFHETAEKRR